MSVSRSDFKTYFVYWCAHLIERIVRFDRYLTERAGNAPSQGNVKHNVIENLRNDIIEIAQSVHIIATRIHRHTELRFENAHTYMAQLQAVVRRISEAHQRLAYLPQPWSEPDTAILIGNVINERVRLETPARTSGDIAPPAHSWTIVLTNEYNLSNIIVDKADAAHADADPFPSVLSLPAIEKDNTLVWASLFHEVGHWISAKQKIGQSILPIVAGYFRSASPSLLVAEYWLEEIIADLIAVDLVGPAYLYAFTNFALYMCCPPLMRPSQRYPSPNARFKYLHERLSHNGGVQVTREAGLSELHMLWGLRLELENGNPTIQGDTIEKYYSELKLGPEEIINFDLQVNKAAQAVVQSSIYQSLFNGGRFQEQDVVICESLTKKLYEGVLIATRNNPVNKRWSVDEVQKEYSSARQLLKEEVNGVAHIMAASAPCRWGWCGRQRMSPVPHLIFADRLFSSFAEQTFSPSVLWELWRPINNLDEMVSNSIEAVSIARFYGDGEVRGGQRHA